MYLFLKLFSYFCKRMDSLFLLQFACFIFMLVNAFFVALAMPIAIFSTTLLYIVGPAVLLALLFFNLTFIALGSSYVPTEELLDKEEENKGSSRTRYMRSGGYRQVLAKKARSFLPSVDSLVALIFTESSRQKKAVLLQNGETSNLQMQHKMIQMELNHFFVKYQRKSKIFIEKQPKRCRIPTNATPFWYECDT